jgi:hypothetical protein
MHVLSGHISDKFQIHIIFFGLILLTFCQLLKTNMSKAAILMYLHTFLTKEICNDTSIYY